MMAAIVSLSGGLDSATVLAEMLYQGREVTAVGFLYGSKHNTFENRCAAKLAGYYDVPFQLIDLTSVMGHFSSSLLKHGGEIPEGHYADSSMSQTVVPARNIIFCSILTGLAWSVGVGEVWLGIHAGDHPIYSDCSPEFFASMKDTITLGSDGRVSLEAPFLHHTKASVVMRGLELKVPYELTRTCYKDQELACGKCGACCERLEAFGINNQKDPVRYE